VSTSHYFTGKPQGENDTQFSYSCKAKLSLDVDYELNVHSSKILMLNSWASRWWYQGGNQVTMAEPSGMGLVPYKRGLRESPSVNQKAGPQQTSNFASTLNMDFPASRTARNKFFCLQDNSVYDILLQ
jgi:hypothetical protein